MTTDEQIAQLQEQVAELSHALAASQDRITETAAQLTAMKFVFMYSYPSRLIPRHNLLSALTRANDHANSEMEQAGCDAEFQQAVRAEIESLSESLLIDAKN